MRASLIVSDYYVSRLGPGSVSSGPEKNTTDYYQPGPEENTMAEIPLRD